MNNLTMKESADRPGSHAAEYYSTQGSPVAWVFDHINVTAPANHPVTENLAAVLGLQLGYRPPFPFPGEWYYQGNNAVLHMVESGPSESARLNHIAFRSEARLDDVLAIVRALGLPHQIARVPEHRQIQIFIPVADSLLIELDIPMNDTAELHDPLESLDQLKEL